MSGLTAQPWFCPALGVIIGLPLALLLLNELHGALVRRASSYARPVALLRNWVLPACAVYLLVAQLEQADVHATWSKLAATVFGFLIMLLLLSGANAALFGEARAGSWRERLPGIFIDLGRLVLIILGVGLLLSWVWGANIGGLIAAVGVTSIVIGLAVQTAVGPVIAGLLLLFEQPFRIGDWLDTAPAKGRVVEVNWRAAHIDTGNGIQIVPNAMLATGSFTNLSRVQGAAYQATAMLAFGPPTIHRARWHRHCWRWPPDCRRGWPIHPPGWCRWGGGQIQSLGTDHLTSRRGTHESASATPRVVCRTAGRTAPRRGQPRSGAGREIRGRRTYAGGRRTGGLDDDAVATMAGRRANCFTPRARSSSRSTVSRTQSVHHRRVGRDDRVRR